MRELSSKTACRSRPSKALGSRSAQSELVLVQLPRIAGPQCPMTESRDAKACHQQGRAAQPPPMTVIQNRFLYRNRFRAGDLLLVNDKRLPQRA